MSMILQKIMEDYPDTDFVVATGFNEAVIGVDEHSLRIIYSIEKCLDILVDAGMEQDEAEEYFDFNVAGAYLGDKTPIWSYP